MKLCYSIDGLSMFEINEPLFLQMLQEFLQIEFLLLQRQLLLDF